MICSRGYKEAQCTTTKPESLKNPKFKKLHFSFLLYFFFLRMTQHSSNLVEVTALQIA